MKIYCDGSRTAWAIKALDSPDIYIAISPNPASSHNVNEYEAIYQALLYAFSKGDLCPQIISDSQLAIRQLNWGLYKIHPECNVYAPVMEACFMKIWKLIACEHASAHPTFTWYHRSWNEAGWLLETYKVTPKT